MVKIKSHWSAALPPLPATELDMISDAVPLWLQEVSCCFWLFRCLHRIESPETVLMGDYCFSRFSVHLAELDSVALTDAFAAFLREDTLTTKDIDAYLAFLRGLLDIRL